MVKIDQERPLLALPQHACVVTRGVAKGGPDRAQAHPSVGCALPMKI